jgi:membrane protein DedA with SNARE-associated domain
MGATEPQAFKLAVLISDHQIDHLLSEWGYLLVFTIVGMQSAGVPVPGTTALIAAALYAGSTHNLAIAGVIVAASLGAVAGQAAGFALGRHGGAKLLRRHGARIGLTPARLKVGRYAFELHGGKLVFLSRFVTGLRTWGALLAGVNRMPPARFLWFAALGAVSWSLWNGLGYYYFGHALATAGAPVSVALAVLAVCVFVLAGVQLRRRGRSLALAAERAYPESLD